jgi:hypothetical protein
MAMMQRGMTYTGAAAKKHGLKKGLKKPAIVKVKKIVDPNRARRWEAILKRIPLDANYIGAEVGVWRGDTGKRLLAARENIFHIMIDPWKQQGKNSPYVKSGDQTALKSQADFDECCDYVRTEVAQYGKRAIIIRKKSKDAVKQFEDKSLDYVFIDGEHTYHAVKEDITMWLPKVKPGGWIGGHDYKNLPRFPGVQTAVDEMFPDGIETDGDHTWFVKVK